MRAIYLSALIAVSRTRTSYSFKDQVRSAKPRGPQSNSCSTAMAKRFPTRITPSSANTYRHHLSGLVHQTLSLSQNESKEFLTGFQDSLRRRPGPAQDRRVSRRRSRCAGRIAPSDAWGNDGERRAPMSLMPISA
jgi:hypothetical protein